MREQQSRSSNWQPGSPPPRRNLTQIILDFVVKWAGELLQFVLWIGGGLIWVSFQFLKWVFTTVFTLIWKSLDEVLEKFGLSEIEKKSIELVVTILVIYAGASFLTVVGAAASLAWLTAFSDWASRLLLIALGGTSVLTAAILALPRLVTVVVAQIVKNTQQSRSQTSLGHSRMDQQPLAQGSQQQIHYVPTRPVTGQLQPAQEQWTQEDIESYSELYKKAPDTSQPVGKWRAIRAKLPPKRQLSQWEQEQKAKQSSEQGLSATEINRRRMGLF